MEGGVPGREVPDGRGHAEADAGVAALAGRVRLQPGGGLRPEDTQEAHGPEAAPAGGRLEDLAVAGVEPDDAGRLSGGRRECVRLPVDGAGEAGVGGGDCDPFPGAGGVEAEPLEYHGSADVGPEAPGFLGADPLEGVPQGAQLPVGERLGQLPAGPASVRQPPEEPLGGGGVEDGAGRPQPAEDGLGVVAVGQVGGVEALGHTELFGQRQRVGDKAEGPVGGGGHDPGSVGGHHPGELLEGLVEFVGDADGGEAHGGLGRPVRIGEEREGAGNGDGRADRRTGGAPVVEYRPEPAGLVTRCRRQGGVGGGQAGHFLGREHALEAGRLDGQP